MEAQPAGIFDETPKANEQPLHEPLPTLGQRQYRPRTCRICLEEVKPTYELPTGALPSRLHPVPNVKWESEDLVQGRLLRPCKCKGSQKYVHEGCLQAWRHTDPSYLQPTFWECPTCKFRYRLERMRWSGWMNSRFTQIALTILILLATIFLFGFIADPILNLYFNPIDTIASIPSQGLTALRSKDDAVSWTQHFIKGLTSLGVLSFAKAASAISPWQWLPRGRVGAGHRRGRGQGAGDRLVDVPLYMMVLGVCTFMLMVWKFVQAWTIWSLAKASEHVADVQGVDDEDDSD